METPIVDYTFYERLNEITNSTVESSNIGNIVIDDDTLILPNGLRLFNEIYLEDDTFSISLTINGLKHNSFLNLFFLDDYGRHNVIISYRDVYERDIPQIISLMRIYLPNAIRCAIKFPIIGEKLNEKIFDELPEWYDINNLRRQWAVIGNVRFTYSIDFNGPCINQFIIFSAISFKSEDSKIAYLPCYSIISGQEDISFLVKVYLTDIKDVLARLLPKYRNFKGNINLKISESINISLFGLDQLLLCFENPDSPGASLCIYSIKLDEQEHTVVFEIPSILIEENVLSLEKLVVQPEEV
jgi:hypothetical protein